MNMYQALRHFLISVPRSQVFQLIGLMLIAAVTEGVGILMLVPALGMLEEEAKMAAPRSSSLPVQHILLLSQDLGLLLALFVGLMVIRGVVQYRREQAAIRLQYHVVDELRERNYSALLGAEWRWLVNTRRSDHADFLLSDVSRIGVGLNQGIALLVTSITLVVHLVVAAMLSWQITVFAVACAGIALYMLAGQRRKAMVLGDHLSRASRSLQSNVQESLAGLKVAKTLGAEQFCMDMFRRTTRHLRAQQLAFAASNSMAKALLMGGGALLLATFLYAGMHIWLLPMSVLLTLVVIFGRLMPILIAGQQQLQYCLHALPALRESQRLLAECKGAAEPPDCRESSQFSSHANIVLENIGVEFSDRRRPALAGISFTMPAGTTTAIIGPSGAGKSTLADILAGLLVADCGELNVGGRVIGGDLRHAWRSQVAYVPQEVFLFHGSVRENLLWARPSATNEDLVSALKLAAADFIFDVPEGIDSIVGDGGLRFSGGERQRLALARALLRQPQLLILDETTSAMDSHISDSIYRSVESLHGALTVVVIAHSPPPNIHVDQVVRLEAGQQVSSGVGG